MKRDACPKGCSPSQQRKLVAQFAASLRKCNAKPAKRTPAKRAKRPAAQRARVSHVVPTLAQLAATVADHADFFARQQQWNAVVRDTFRAGAGPSAHRAFSNAQATRAARAIEAPAPEPREARTRTRAARVLPVPRDKASKPRRSKKHGLRLLPAPAVVEVVKVRELPAPRTRKGRAVALATDRQREGLLAADRAFSRLDLKGWAYRFYAARRDPTLTRKQATFYGTHDLREGIAAAKHSIDMDIVVRELIAEARAKIADREPRAKQPRAKRGRLDVSGIEMTVESLESDPWAIPQPIGPEDYRPPQCAANHEPWSSDYESALEEARERASIESGEDDEAGYRRIVHDAMASHPSFSSWSSTERACVADFRARHPRKARRTVTASDETRAAIEDASREAGYDMRGSAEHLDRLSLGGQAAYWRRLHRKTGSVDALRRAREIEARNRAKKRKGAGVQTFAVG